MASIREQRRVHYEFYTACVPYVNDWRRNPYTFIKSRFYIESSAVLVCLLLKTNVTPNTVTLAYALSAILGGVLLSIPVTPSIVTGVLIFFTRGILDWSDGHLARARAQASFTGRQLDSYGGLVNSLAFQSGFGLYVASHTGSTAGYYMLVVLLFVRSSLIVPYVKQKLCDDVLHGRLTSVPATTGQGASPRVDAADPQGILGARGKTAMRWLSALLDDRARSVDFICLVILVELYTQSFFLSSILFSFIVFKYVVIWTGEIYVVMKKGYLERLSRHFVSDPHAL